MGSRRRAIVRELKGCAYASNDARIYKKVTNNPEEHEK
jgi:hypothetical protein